ncbi:MAG: hypothetical protein AAB300_03675 [Nitrospirota bacterium]
MIKNLSAFFLCFCLLSCTQNDDWGLPIHLGDSKTHVYSVLGSPSFEVKGNADIHWFQNSGLTLLYDPAGNVSSIVVPGHSNSSGFLTYKEPVIFDLKVTDTIKRFETLLGAPISKEDSILDDSLGTFVWRKTPYLIKADFWSKDYSERGTIFKEGTIVSIEISKGYGGN